MIVAFFLRSPVTVLAFSRWGGCSTTLTHFYEKRTMKNTTKALVALTFAACLALTGVAEAGNHRGNHGGHHGGNHGHHNNHGGHYNHGHNHGHWNHYRNNYRSNYYGYGQRRGYNYGYSNGHYNFGWRTGR